MTGCVPAVKVCKTVASVKLWGFDYTEQLANFWEPGRYHANGVKVRPTVPNGWQYTSNGGTSAFAEPRWPKVNGGQVVDGSKTWTAEPVGNGSLRTTIVDSEWTSDDGITTASAAYVNTNGEQSTSVQVSAGVVGDNVQEVRNTVTFADGTIDEGIFEVTVQE